MFLLPHQSVPATSTYVFACIPAYRHNYIPTCLHTYIFAYLPTCIHSYINGYIHTLYLEGFARLFALGQGRTQNIGRLLGSIQCILHCASLVGWRSVSQREPTSTNSLRGTFLCAFCNLQRPQTGFGTSHMFVQLKVPFSYGYIN